MARQWNPVKVGRSECTAWSAYYRRDWPRVLVGAFGMVWYGFRLDPLRTLLAAAYVLRANQVWAPYPDNDTVAARALMTSFSRLVDRAGRVDVDPEVAADLEVTGWHVHRHSQHDPEVPADVLVSALTDLYAYVYHTDAQAVRPSAELRVQAMALSDTWVAAGCRLDGPVLQAEREALVGSYIALAVL